MESKEFDPINYGTPVQVKITNTTNEIKTACLFGFSENFNKPNFGSDENVNIQCGVDNVSYSYLLSDSAFNLKKYKWLFIHCDVKQQLDQIIRLHHLDGTGMGAMVPFDLSKKDKHKNYKGQYVLSCEFRCNINSQTHISIPVLPNSSLVITLFPEKRSVENKFRKNNILNRTILKIKKLWTKNYIL
jgi:hypothetical protein